ncbi:MAG: cyclophilin-like fold protein [Eubacteriales bacterium]|nr:cyclophilin-like fold protein [Eubacteriales bacterium]
MKIHKKTIGKNEIIANLYDNNSTKELLNILEEGAITLSASNYGGFEKVCKLPKSISSKDTQIKAEAGDIMLYNNNQIVFFYGTNTWAYTRLGKVVDENIDSLKNILSGNDTSLVIELVKEEKNRTFGKK